MDISEGERIMHPGVVLQRGAAFARHSQNAGYKLQGSAVRPVSGVTASTREPISI